MAKRIDNYYSERAAYYIVEADSIDNDTWFDERIQPAFAADHFNASGYYVENNKIVGLRFMKGKEHPDFKYKKSLGYFVPKPNSEAFHALKQVAFDLNIFGFGSITRFQIKAIDNYENIMSQNISDEKKAELAEANTKIRTVEVFRCETNSDNQTYLLTRSSLAVGFRIPDLEKAQQDLIKLYPLNTAPMPIPPMPEQEGVKIHRVNVQQFAAMMRIQQSAYHLNEDNTVLELPEHTYTTTSAFFEYLLSYINEHGLLPDAVEDSDLPEVTLWRPEVRNEFS